MTIKRIIMQAVVLLIFGCSQGFSHGVKEIILEYEHSMRLENKSIIISLEEITDLQKQIKVVTGSVQIDGMIQPELTKEIEADVFKTLFIRCTKLNLHEIIIGGSGLSGFGGDGNNVTLSFRNSLSGEASVTVWTPSAVPERRKLEEFYAITMDIFKLFGLEELY